MSIDRIIFPHPKPQYTEQDIPNKDETASIQFIDSPSVKNSNEIHKVPVMVMAYKLYEESYDSYILFFHGNAEDLGTSMRFLKLIRETLRANIIAVEYPSYGIYKKKVSAEQIKSDALKVYDSLLEMGIDQSKIIVFGRSIGTGPACEIGAKRKPGGIILLSAFTSIKKLSGEIAFSLVSYFIKERFNNIENVTRFSSPCLLIHGQADNLIKFEHSKQLQQALEANSKQVSAIYPENMTHNQFQFRKDIMRPIELFLKKISFQPVKIQVRFLPQLIQKSIHTAQLGDSQAKMSEDQQNIESKQTQIQQTFIDQQIKTDNQYQIDSQKSIIRTQEQNTSVLLEKQQQITPRPNNLQKYIEQSEAQQDANTIQAIQAIGLNDLKKEEPKSQLQPNTLFKSIKQSSQERKQQLEEFKLNKDDDMHQGDDVEDDVADKIEGDQTDSNPDQDEDDEDEDEDDYYYIDNEENIDPPQKMVEDIIQYNQNQQPIITDEDENENKPNHIHNEDDQQENEIINNFEQKVINVIN